MIFEKNGLDLTDKSLLTDDLGDTWLAFAASITDFNTYTFNTSYNLISISDPQSTIGGTILELLIDESTTTTEKTIAVRNVLFTNIISLVRNFGIVIDEDMLTINHLPALNTIIDLIYTLDGFEDLLSISEVLESSDMDPVDRFIRVLSIINDLDDVSVYEHLIMSVSLFTLDTLRLSLVSYDQDVPVHVDVAKRIRGNRPFLAGTLAWSHIVNGGNIGGAYSLLINAYQKELTDIEATDPEKFIKEVTAFAVISELESAEILEQVNKEISTTITDPKIIFKADKMISGLKLEGNDEKA